MVATDSPEGNFEFVEAFLSESCSLVQEGRKSICAQFCKGIVSTNGASVCVRLRVFSKFVHVMLLTSVICCWHKFALQT
jgi:hypothetical protein